MTTDVNSVKAIYPFEEWRITEKEFNVAENYRNETIFSLANGYIGMRGNFEEGFNGPEKTGIEGNFINGFYESEDIKYGEKGYAYADKSQTMLNVTNPKVIRLCVDGEELDMLQGTISNYERVLDLKTGMVTRELTWTSTTGKSVRIKTERLASFERKNICAFHYEVEALNFDGELKVTSVLDGDAVNSTPETNARIDYGPYDRVLLLEEKETEGDVSLVAHRTKNTGFKLITVMKNELESEGDVTKTTFSNEYEEGLQYTIKIAKGQKATLNKFVCYTTSLERSEDVIIAEAKEMLSQADEMGYDGLREEQISFMNEFWEVSDIVIKGDEALQQGIRFNMFHLLQATGRDGKTSVGAKGLSGEGYEGHCFWDTEMYALPFFLYSTPEISKKLIEYRYNTLDKARERARQMSHEKGALYPWRTINGEEASPYFPAGTAQFHINADVAFAVQKYFEVTGDKEFYAKCCVEILAETARFWEDFGAFIETKDNKFCINGVTGPDEYTAIVNNNCYTNLFARENLRNGYEAINWLKKYDEKAYKSLAERIQLGDEEPKAWKKAADNMYIPYSEELEIYPQDDSFLFKKRFDVSAVPEDKFPLLDNHHFLVLYRHQICKQADLVLALFLLSHQFTKDDLKKNFDYYEPVTVHESSLSACIFSIVATEIGYHDQAYDFFMSSARLDLDDYHKNTKAGIHMANLAGTWMCIVNGFGGMRVHDGQISFNPTLPEQWDEYTFKVSYQGRLIEIMVTKEDVSYKLVRGEALTIIDRDKEILLQP